MIHRCCICDQPAPNQLSLRCRVKVDNGKKKKTNALWAPDLNAWLCDEHALGGVDVSIQIVENGWKKTRIHVNDLASVVVPIKDPVGG